MLRAILFDLDGTLLGNDMDAFLKPYFASLAASFEGILPKDKLMAQVMASTMVMMRDLDPTRTNQEVFMADFLPKIGLAAEVAMPKFDAFYARRFKDLEKYTFRKPAARVAVAKAFDKGLKVAIATNPMFPIHAISERLRWAGVVDFPYDLITSYEVMHFCKPQLQYYQEICDLLGARPEEAMMVGNDIHDDMVAGRLGLKTFLVDEEPVGRDGTEPTVDYRGNLQKLVDSL